MFNNTCIRHNLVAVILLLLTFGCAARAQLPKDIYILPDASEGGKLCHRELLSNGDHEVCIESPTSLAASIDITLPSSLPGSTECLQISSSGVISTSGAVCGGGGSSLPVDDETSIVEGSVDDTKEVTFEVDGLTTATVRELTVQDADYTIAGLEVAQTWTEDQTFENIYLQADDTWDIGELATRVNEIFSKEIWVRQLRFRQTTGATHEFYFVNQVGNNLSLHDSSSNNIFEWDSATPEVTVGDSGADYDLVPHTNASQALGTTSKAWDAYLDQVVVDTDIMPDVDGGADIGADGTVFFEAYVEDYYAGDANSRTGSLTMYHQSESTSVGIRAANVTSVTDIETFFGSASAALYPDSDSDHDLGLSTRRWETVYGDDADFTQGADSTLTCGAGEAVKNITVSGGIVTSVSCGTP